MGILSADLVDEVSETVTRNMLMHLQCIVRFHSRTGDTHITFGALIIRRF